MPHAQPREQRPSAPVRPQLPRNVAYRTAVSASSPASPNSSSAPGTPPLRAVPRLAGSPDKPLLRQPNPAEYMWLAECRDHLLAPDQPLPTLAWLSQYFDRYLEQWISLPSQDRWNPKAALNSISVLMGDMACRQVPGAKWVIEQTGNVTSAIVATAPELTSSPFIAVFSAWQRGFPDAMYGSFTRVVTSLIPPVPADIAIPAPGAEPPTPKSAH